MSYWKRKSGNRREEERIVEKRKGTISRTRRTEEEEELKIFENLGVEGWGVGPYLYHYLRYHLRLSTSFDMEIFVVRKGGLLKWKFLLLEKMVISHNLYE